MTNQQNDPLEEPSAESSTGPRPLPPFDDAEVIAAPVNEVERSELNRKAVCSVVFGIALIIPSVGLGFFAGLVSITSAVHARREIELSKGAQRGDRLAQIGMSIGALLLIKSALLFLLHSR